MIATLIADAHLTGEMVAGGVARLAAAGVDVASHDWIDAGSAADIAFTGDAAAARAALADWDAPVDVVVQPAHGRRKALMVADMDSTMIAQECIDELADYAGIKPQIAAITAAAMRGELDFAAALNARVALLAGLPESVLADCLAQRVTLTPGARTLVQTMRAHGARAVLVSGGFTHFADAVGAMCGFDHVVANGLDLSDGRLTGTVRAPIVDSGTKAAQLAHHAAALGVDVAAVLAVGDGANDAPMLRAAGLGIAFHAHRVAQDAADAVINHGDLTALLWAQGYPRIAWRAA